LNPAFASFGFRGTFGRPVSQVHFSAAARNPRLQLRWNFGDPASGAANTATGPDVDHAFPSPATYTTTLTVLDGGTVIAESRREIALP
jgi:PKD repeat protein